MLRLFALLVLLLLLAALPNCSGEGGSESAPGRLAGRSLVLVVADSLHATHLSAYGNERETSPFIDRLASRGIRSERALSQTSWTLSSVTTLFTGLVQERHGVRLLDERLPEGGPATLAELFRRKGYRTVGLVQNAVVGADSGLGRGFDRYQLHRFSHEGSEELVRDAASELATLESDDRPLFLYVHFGPPHMPYQPPEPFLSRFEGAAPESAIEGTIRETAEITTAGLAQDHPDVLRLVELYDGHIAYVDDLVRRFAEPYLAPGAEDRIAVLFTSDHGEAFMQHGAVGHNYFCYEPMVRIPWILTAPGAVSAGIVLAGPTSMLDTLPTLADLFDLPLPSGRLDGESLVPRFDDPASAPDRELYLTSRYGKQGTPGQYALVDGPWKLVQWKDEPLMLFDVSADPEEQVDLAGTHPERVGAMSRRLAERRVRHTQGLATSESATMTDARMRELEALGYGGDAFDAASDR